MNILLTGSDGFVGSNLYPRLLEHDVITLDYLTTLKPANINPDNIFMNFDLSTGIPPIDVKLDLIIHLATVNQLAISTNPKLVNVNTSAIHNIIELAMRDDARLIFSSSCSVYGEGENLREEYLLYPQSLYGIGKQYEEKVIWFYIYTHGLDATILRFSNCYGDTTNIENKVYPGKKDVIRIFMENIMNGKPVPLIHGMGRDYTYIDDVVEAILAMIPFRMNGVYNVGTGVETLTDDLPIMIADALGKSVTIDSIPPRESDNIQYRSLNIDKISPYWKPKNNLKDGLRKYADKFAQPA